jgi:hypothetical protein
MIHIFSNIIKVIVFSTCTDAFLAVGSSDQTTHVTVWIHCALKYWLELFPAKIQNQPSFSIINALNAE